MDADFIKIRESSYFTQRVGYLCWKIDKNEITFMYFCLSFLQKINTSIKIIKISTNIVSHWKNTVSVALVQ